MQESATLDEIDYLLVTALQREPRAEWRRIGAELGIDPSTAARRWSRLTEAGLAWLTCYPAWLPPGALITFIELDCAPGRVHEVALALADDPHLFTIEHVTGGRDLLLTASFTGQAQLASYIGFRLGAVPGITATRTHVASILHAEGSRWRLDRLAFPAAGPSPAPAFSGHGTLSPDDLALIHALARDVRQSAAALAERTGLSPTTARRRLARLERDGLMAYRCEVSRSHSGWPVSVTLWGSAPAEDAASITARLAHLRETRMCVSLSGAHNILLTVWLRAVDGLPAFEASLAARVPELAITDRTLTLWNLKFAGQLLSPEGRRLRSVPLALWTPDDAHAAEAAFVSALATPPPLRGSAPDGRDRVGAWGGRGAGK
ncbi:Lrp/AsnC family transcriptional regulator [Actinocorallia populi]|uniref:Lrp/AsnC family transcriptional regulator n=1 Tax=Actinocorallia populi TaxID=2079200 RepID=UPI000D08B7AD|nr:Lrp/AsnC family transcriptional regulator [Actinocorallia populi]